MLNTELHDELPALYDSRILFLVTNLQTLFASEQMFHNEITKIYSELEAIVDKLATDSQRGSYTLKKLNCKQLHSRTFWQGGVMRTGLILLLATPNNVQSSTIKSGHEISNSAISKYPAPITNGNSATNGGKSHLIDQVPRKSFLLFLFDSLNRDKVLYIFLCYTPEEI